MSRIFRYLLIVPVTALFGFASLHAQTPAAISHATSQTITLDNRQRQEINFELSVLGGVTLQIVQNAQRPSSDEATMPLGIAGVKVSLRSRDRGFENWVLVQSTDARGNFTFECLRPGKYKIEVDPATLPKSAGTETP